MKRDGMKKEANFIFPSWVWLGMLFVYQAMLIIDLQQEIKTWRVLFDAVMLFGNSYAFMQAKKRGGE